MPRGKGVQMGHWDLGADSWLYTHPWSHWSKCQGHGLTVTLRPGDSGHLSRLPGGGGTAFGLEGQLRLGRFGSAPASTEKEDAQLGRQWGHSEKGDRLLCPGSSHHPMGASRAGELLVVAGDLMGEICLFLSRNNGVGEGCARRAVSAGKAPATPPHCLTL